MIVIGIDPHKKTHTAVAVDGAGAGVAAMTVPAHDKGHDRLLAWAVRLGSDRRWAVEDCRHVSGRLDRFLVGQGEHVVRVPPKLMAGARRSARTRGKSDPVDATAVARAALREPDLPRAALADAELDLRLLLDHREDLVAERSKVQCRLRWHLHALDPGIAIPAGALDRHVWLDSLDGRLGGLPESVRLRIARELVARCRMLSAEAAKLEKEIRALTKKLAPDLLELPGCGALTPAKIIGEVAGVGRFRTDTQLALHAGVAPLEASSGERRRHRLNRSGNRQLNLALHRMAVAQGRSHEPARQYLKRKEAEGKSRMATLRCLKRLLVRLVFTVLRRAEARRLNKRIGPDPVPVLT